ncbi:alpha/beta fold hydrolase [Jiella pelagia]|uniref:Alpha/beta hydrolase n=1 Tax=Jiella pelagia TaxID=2986949 RepID=A0ABY7C2Q0_9HYPH|nr:alpha/beta hydrolase [Jiella pelagia]WAP69902.1 alpha/beta hydrolase [Jiella pelagia]
MAPKDDEPFFYDHDGLRLAGRLWGAIGQAGDAGGSAPLPIVCLPGLTRNSRDFADLARRIRDDEPDRPVVAFDYRGRGLSEYASDPEAYTVPAEAVDTLAGLDHLGISRAVFVGTSRGALVIHLIAAMRLPAIAGAVFNDAGPRLEIEGLETHPRHGRRRGVLSRLATRRRCRGGIARPELSGDGARRF